MMTRVRIGLAALVLGSTPLHAMPVDTRIGIRFVVDHALENHTAKQSSIQTQLSEHVHTLNRFLRESAVWIQADIVHIDFRHIQSVEAVEILNDMRAERHGFEGLFHHADRWGADVTVAVVKKLTLRGQPGCGRAWAVNKTLSALATTANSLMVYHPICGAHTLAHELGHLMGLNHGHLVDRCQPNQGHASAITRYANGFAVGNCDGQPQPGEFGTIMVGGWMKQIMGNDKASLPLFSNPRLQDARCGLSGICGDPEYSDEARALNEHARHFAGHEEPDVDTLPFPDPGVRQCIREQYQGVEIDTLQQLHCPDRGILDLTGVERLTALHHLDLSGNNPIPCAALTQHMQTLDSVKLVAPNHCLPVMPK
ncbi:MAG: hypothetical protein G8237_02065 [Magnetococcales bacterium]|nr:hypothetical protein [Magnetococcales bacterium]NGZ05119.1 hypothetical protein [Magnetococcales bacterium]